MYQYADKNRDNLIVNFQLLLKLKKNTVGNILFKRYKHTKNPKIS